VTKKIEVNPDQQRDTAAAARITSLNQKQRETKTPKGPKRVRFSLPGPSLTREYLRRHQLMQQNDQLAAAAAAARTAAAEAGRRQLEEANQAYEQAYLENLTELEFGPRCHCNRYPWQHELHPSGTAKGDREREGQRGGRAGERSRWSGGMNGGSGDFWIGLGVVDDAFDDCGVLW
jgi:hypothetical protein